MSNPQKVEYSQLEPGHEFPPASAALDGATVSAYLKAVGETSPLYQGSDLVPPTAVAALAMAALSEQMTLPPGTIHVSQELEFKAAVSVNDTITTRARVSGKRVRGKLALMTIDLEVSNQSGTKVLFGKTSFMLPGG